MDWTTFKSETLEYLWRVGDTELDARMSKIVRTAESRMRTDLKLAEAEIVTPISVTSTPVPIPADVSRIRSVLWTDYGPGAYVTLYEYTMPGYDLLDYSVAGNQIYHRLPASVTTPVEMMLTYTPTSSGLEAGDTALFDAYPDLYEACVYAEACSSLRDEAEEAKYNAKYQARLDEVRTDQNRRRYVGSPLKMSMPRRDVS